MAPGTAIHPVVKSPSALLLIAKRSSISRIIAYLCGGKPTARCCAGVLRTRVTSTLYVRGVVLASALSHSSNDDLFRRFDQAWTAPPVDEPDPPQPWSPCLQRLQEEPKSQTVSYEVTALRATSPQTLMRIRGHFTVDGSTIAGYQHGNTGLHDPRRRTLRQIRIRLSC